MDNATKYLKIKDGRFVTIRKFPNSVKELYAEDLQDAQGTAPKVMIKRHNDSKAKIHLTIIYENIHYSPKVHNDTLKLEKVVEESNEYLDDSHWFEKVNQGSGEYYSLRSVSKPWFYLYTRGKKMSISRDVQKSCLVKEINTVS